MRIFEKWKQGLQWMKIQDGIGEPPWGGFSVEWSRATASELEVTGNPLERLKNAIGENLSEVYYAYF